MQRRIFLKQLAGCSSIAALSACSNTYNYAADVKEKRLYVDGLSFVSDNATDMKASQLDSFIADISAIEEVKRADGSVNYKRTYKACMKSIKEKTATMLAAQDIYHIAKKGSDIVAAKKNNKCTVFLQIQGADCVEGGLEQVDEFHQLGLRVLQLTHHYNNVYAGGALSLEQKGLSRKGLALIDKLESKKMLIDLSHASVASAEDTLARAKGPIVQTHGAARAIINNARCMPDHILKGIAGNVLFCIF